MRIAFLALGSLLLTAGAASAHWANDGSQNNWYDFGQSLGGFGPSPVGAPIGACWTTDSGFFDPTEPEYLSPGGVLGHQGGLGVDRDGNCNGQAANPTVFARGSSANGVGVQVGANISG